MSASIIHSIWDNQPGTRVSLFANECMMKESLGKNKSIFYRIQTVIFFD